MLKKTRHYAKEAGTLSKSPILSDRRKLNNVMISSASYAVIKCSAESACAKMEMVANQAKDAIDEEQAAKRAGEKF